MIALKIGRHEYNVTEDDQFMDNKFCVQLLAQSKEKSSWGHRPSPVLSKKAVKQISVFTRKQILHGYDQEKVRVFSLIA